MRSERPNWNDLPTDIWMRIFEYAEVVLPPTAEVLNLVSDPTTEVGRLEARRRKTWLFQRDLVKRQREIQKKVQYRLICKNTKDFCRKDLYTWVFTLMDLRLANSLKQRSSPHKLRFNEELDRFAEICYAYHAALDKSQWDNCRMLLVQAYAFLNFGLREARF